MLLSCLVAFVTCFSDVDELARHWVLASVLFRCKCMPVVVCVPSFTITLLDFRALVEAGCTCWLVGCMLTAVVVQRRSRMVSEFNRVFEAVATLGALAAGKDSELKDFDIPAVLAL